MRKYEDVDRLRSYCEENNISPSVANPFLSECGSSQISESRRIADIATRPEVSLAELLKIVPRGTFDSDVTESVEISIKYRGYIDREIQNAEKLHRLENLKIPDNFDFDRLSGLSIECRQKLKRYAPHTIAQAMRISGVSPSDISVLLVYFGR